MGGKVDGPLGDSEGAIKPAVWALRRNTPEARDELGFGQRFDNNAGEQGRACTTMLVSLSVRLGSRLQDPVRVKVPRPADRRRCRAVRIGEDVSGDQCREIVGESRWQVGLRVGARRGVRAILAYAQGRVLKHRTLENEAQTRAVLQQH